MMHGGGWWSYISHDPSQAKPKLDRKLLRRVLVYAQPYWWMVGLILVAIVAISLIELLPPLILRQLIDVTLPTKNLSQLNLLALALMAIPVLSGLIDVGQRYLSARVGEGIIFDLRQQMYEHLSRMALRFFTNTKSGEIISRFNNDVVGAQNAITGTMPNIVTNVVTLVSTLAVMISIEWRLDAAVGGRAAALPAAGPAGGRRAARHPPPGHGVQRRAEQHHHRDAGHQRRAAGQDLWPAAAGAGRASATSIGQVRDMGIRRALVGRWFFLGLGIAAAIGTALIYWVGGHLVLRTR